MSHCKVQNVNHHQDQQERLKQQER
jgi:hypothetical protein